MEFREGLHYCKSLLTLASHSIGRTITHRRTEYVAAFDNFTFFPLDESDLPWPDEPHWFEYAQMPEIDLTPATEAVMPALQNVGVEVEEHVEDSEAARKANTESITE